MMLRHALTVVSGRPLIQTTVASATLIQCIARPANHFTAIIPAPLHSTHSFHTSSHLAEDAKLTKLERKRFRRDRATAGLPNAPFLRPAPAEIDPSSATATIHEHENLARSALTDTTERVMTVEEMKAEEEAKILEEKLEAEKKRPLTPEEKTAREKEVKSIHAFLASLKLTDSREKIFKANGGIESIEYLLKLNTRDLRELGLTVKQRKEYLKLMDRYRVQMRANEALAFIRRNGLKLSPARLQAGVYQIMYRHVYERNRVEDENKRLEKEWRKPITEYRTQRRYEHSDLRGIREPEIMEMAKMEALQLAAAWSKVKPLLAIEKQNIAKQRHAAYRVRMGLPPEEEAAPAAAATENAAPATDAKTEATPAAASTPAQ